MCGIVAYAGPQRRFLAKEAVRLLAALEYRGYDSSGVLWHEEGGVFASCRAVGGVEKLRRVLRRHAAPSASTVLAHTRWATHGAATEANAHPITTPDGSLAIVLNGVVENDLDLRRELAARGVTFATECDAETALALVADALSADSAANLGSACAAALERIRGRVAFVVLRRGAASVGELAAARRGSPLFFARDGDGCWIVSDPAALPVAARPVHELSENQCLHARQGQVRTLGGGVPRLVEVREVEGAAQGAHESFMEKEIYEQEESVARAVAAATSGLALSMDIDSGFTRIVLLGSGSAYHACLAAKHLFERWARVPADAVVSSEFLSSDPVLDTKTLVIAASQSGETADTLAAASRCVESGATLFAVTNAPYSSLSRLARATLAVAAGTEISVASTKAYTGMLVRLTFLAAELALRRKQMNPGEFRALVASAQTLPAAIRSALATRDQIADAARRWSEKRAFLFIGRGLDHPSALEGALKLRELSYRNAEGHAAGELKHGTIALLEQGYPVIATSLNESTHAKSIAAMREVTARGGALLTLCRRGDQDARAVAELAIELDVPSDAWSPVIAAVPLQWLALEVARALGRNVDRPRNLAKSVTVV